MSIKKIGFTSLGKLYDSFAEIVDSRKVHSCKIWDSILTVIQIDVLSSKYFLN